MGCPHKMGVEPDGILFDVLLGRVWREAIEVK